MIGRRTLLVSAAAATLLLATSTTVVGATPVSRYVAPGGTDTGDCSDAAEPCATIQYAVDHAGAGDVVSLAAGTYVETVNTPASPHKDYTNLPMGASIVGAGPGRTIVSGPGECAGGTWTSMNALFIGGTSVALRSMSVGCAMSAVQAFGTVTIEDVEFLATAEHGVDTGYGDLFVTGSTFRGRYGIGSRGASIRAVRNTFETGELAVHVLGVPEAPPDLAVIGNRLAGPGADIRFDEGPFDTIDLSNDWWGCNEGPGGGDGCAAVVDGAGIEVTSWLQLALLRMDPTTAGQVGLTFGFAPSGKGFPPATIRFSATCGSVEPAETVLVNGLARATFTQPESSGSCDVTASLDNGTRTITLDVPLGSPSPPASLPAVSPAPSPSASSEAVPVSSATPPATDALAVPTEDGASRTSTMLALIALAALGSLIVARAARAR